MNVLENKTLTSTDLERRTMRFVWMWMTVEREAVARFFFVWISLMVLMMILILLYIRIKFSNNAYVDNQVRTERSTNQALDKYYHNITLVTLIWSQTNANKSGEQTDVVAHCGMVVTRSFRSTAPLPVSTKTCSQVFTIAHAFLRFNIQQNQFT